MAKIKRIKFIILFLFLLNFITGLLLINEGLFHPDSIILAQAVENTYKTAQLQPATFGRYGSVIINSILYLPFFILGHNADFTVRFSSVLFHSLSIVMLFLLIKELFNNYLHALFGALLFSFVPFYFSVNAFGKEHAVSIFFLLATFYLLCQGLTKKSLSLIAFSSLIFVFAITVKESVLVTLPLFFLLYLSPKVSVRPFKMNIIQERLSLKFLISFLLPLILSFAFIFLAYFKDIFYRNLFINDSGTAYFLGFFSPVFGIALRGLFSSIPVPLFIFLILGIYRLNFEGNFLRLFFLFWLALILYFANISSHCPRHLDIVMIPICVFASYALYDLYTKDRLLSLAILIYLVFSMFVFMYPMLFFRHHYNGEKQFALYVKEKTPENAIIIAMDDSPFIEYYGKRKAIIHPIGDSTKQDVFIGEIKEYLKKGIPVYLIESGLSYDSTGAFKKAIFSNYDIKVIGQKLAEDWHRPELNFQTYYEKLFRLSLKAKTR